MIFAPPRQSFTALRRLLAALLLALALPGLARAQCEPVWQPFDASTRSVAGTDGEVRATVLWDRDGPGPQPPFLVAAGNFTLAGNTRANSIAVYDPATGQWSALGAGLRGDGSGTVTAVAALPNGDLIASGTFTTLRGGPANRIARWSDAAGVWSPLGSGLSSEAKALAALPNGDVVAAGSFTTAGGVSVNNIARWSPATGAWSALGSGITGVPANATSSPGVNALAVMPNGDLLAGGFFTTAGGAPANYIARWDGAAWSDAGANFRGQNSADLFTVLSLFVMQNGDLVVGGTFTFIGEMRVNRVARWNGTAWSALGPGLDGSFPSVAALAQLPGGDLVAAGSFSSANWVRTTNIARWNGYAWVPLAEGLGSRAQSLAVLPDGDLIAGGLLFTAGTTPVRGVARWNGSAWSALTSGIQSSVYDVAVFPTGHLAIGGAFSSIGSLNVSRLAAWNGSTWSALGPSFNADVQALQALPNGDLIAAGCFSTVGSVSANRIARWSAATGTWSALGTGFGGPASSCLTDLALLPNGDLVAAGGFSTAGGVAANNIARWNSATATWSPLGSGVNGTILEMLVLPNGDLIVGGAFTAAGDAPASNIACWNFATATWSPLGAGVNSTVWALALLPNGDLVVGGDFGAAGNVYAPYVARWNGSTWSAMGSGITGRSRIRTFLTLPNGDLLAGGSFNSGGTPTLNGVSRWNGSTWTPLGSGPFEPWTFGSGVYSLSLLPDGDVLVAGDFTSARGIVAPNLARWGPPRVMVTSPPASQVIPPGHTLTLTASVGPRLTGVTVQWQRNGVNITDGPGGASPGGGTVSGATATLPSPTTGAAVTLTITGAQFADQGQYTAVFTSPCDAATSAPATVIIAPPPCNIADITAIGGPPALPDGLLTGDDFAAFIAAFTTGNPGGLADITGIGGPPASPDGLLTGDDFNAFIAAFASGCP